MPSLWQRIPREVWLAGRSLIVSHWACEVSAPLCSARPCLLLQGIPGSPMGPPRVIEGEPVQQMACLQSRTLFLLPPTCR